jgi:hypothetical protein
MRGLGYQWLVLDDCWHPTRAVNGTLIPLPSSFPHGMKVCDLDGWVDVDGMDGPLMGWIFFIFRQVFLLLLFCYSCYILSVLLSLIE